MEGTAGRGHSLLMTLITILWERADDVTLQPPRGPEVHREVRLTSKMGAVLRAAMGRSGAPY